MSKESQPEESTDLDILDFECPEFIAALRLYAGTLSWSWQRLANETGLSIGTIHGWRRNKSRPTLENVQTLCSVFEVRLSEFFATGEAIVDEERVRREGTLFDALNMTPDEFAEWFEGLSEPNQLAVRRTVDRIEALAEEIVARDLKGEEKAG